MSNSAGNSNGVSLTAACEAGPWRRGGSLKTEHSHGVVPLWPQLEQILRDYLEGPHRPTGRLLFPGRGVDAMVTDFRKTLDAVAARIGFKKGELHQIEQVYSHLGELRHRSEVVEYRVDQHISNATVAAKVLELRQIAVVA